MRVAVDAHMVGSRETGNEAYIRNLLRGFQSLAVSGVQFDILHTAQTQTLWDTASPTEGFGAVQIIPRNPFLRIPWAIPRIVRRRSIDVLHMTYNAPPRRLDSALVVSVHDLAYKLYAQYYPLRVRLLLSLLVPLSVRRADIVICLSEHSKRDIIREYSVEGKKIVVTPGAASPEFCYLERTSACLLGEIKERYGVKGPFFLAVGNLEPRKNLIRLVRAFHSLRQGKGIAHRLVIAGQAHWKASSIGRMVEQLGLNDEVIFTGYVPIADLVLLYNAASAFVYPSLYEGFGLPILEAMSCGTPVIASNVASLPEVAGDAALLVDPLSEQSLADAMSCLLTDKSLQISLREKGLRHAEKFSWESTARLTLKAYERALAMHRTLDDSVERK